jgi:gamma-glutamyl-gamma-aminobutyrate hydrolase PuuD
MIVPDGKLWNQFGPLHVYALDNEYILALKITAGCQKDLDVCAILLPKTTIRTRQQAQQVVDRYILPGGQQKHAERIENALNRRCGREG